MKAVKNYLKDEKIFCIKYNHALDPEGQINTSQPCFIQLDDSQSELKLRITNLKPKQEVRYILNDDPEQLH